VRVFLDANVLFSASNLTSSIAELLVLAASRQELVTCTTARQEAWRNVVRKRPTWFQGFLGNSRHVLVVKDGGRDLPVEIAPKDVVVLASAIDCGANLLVTGDRRHFGHLYGTSVDGVRIGSVADWAVSVVEGRLG
jgi:uncharacterized protein